MEIVVLRWLNAQFFLFFGLNFPIFLSIDQLDHFGIPQIPPALIYFCHLFSRDIVNFLSAFISVLDHFIFSSRTSRFPPEDGLDDL